MVASIYPGFTADEPTPAGRALVTAIDAPAQRSLLGLGYDVADDSAVVHLAGVETISGAKTFSGGATINQLDMGSYGQLIGVCGMAVLSDGNARIGLDYSGKGLQVSSGKSIGFAAGSVIDGSDSDVQFQRVSPGVVGVYLQDGLTLGTLNASTIANPAGPLLLTGAGRTLRIDEVNNRTRLMNNSAAGIDIQANENTNALLRVTYASADYPLSVYKTISGDPGGLVNIDRTRLFVGTAVVLGTAAVKPGIYLGRDQTVTWSSNPGTYQGGWQAGLRSPSTGVIELNDGNPGLLGTLQVSAVDEPAGALRLGNTTFGVSIGGTLQLHPGNGSETLWQTYGITLRTSNALTLKHGAGDEVRIQSHLSGLGKLGFYSSATARQSLITADAGVTTVLAEDGVTLGAVEANSYKAGTGSTTHYESERIWCNSNSWKVEHTPTGRAHRLHLGAWNNNYNKYVSGIEAGGSQTGSLLFAIDATGEATDNVFAVHSNATCQSADPSTALFSISESGDASFSGVTRFTASGTKNKWQSYGQAAQYDTTFDGNNLVCNYATMTLRNNWGAVNISGATGVDLANIRVAVDAVFKNTLYPLGAAIFRKADGTGVTDGGTAATALVWRYYLDGSDTAAAFTRNDGRFTLQGVFGQRIIFGSDRNFNIYSTAGNYFVKTLSDSGLIVRNGADSADASLIAGTGTFSGTVSSPGGTNQSGERFGAGTSAAQYSVAIGNSANASGEASITVGYQSSSSYMGVTCGYHASAGWQGIAIGGGASTATTYGSGGIAIGRLSSAVEGSAAFGQLATNTTVGTLAIGSASVPLSLNVTHGGATLNGLLLSKVATSSIQAAIFQTTDDGATRNLTEWRSSTDLTVASVSAFGGAAFNDVSRIGESPQQGVYFQPNNAGHSTMQIGSNTAYRTAGIGFWDAINSHSWRMGRNTYNNNFYIQPGYIGSGIIDGINGFTISPTGDLTASGASIGKPSSIANQQILTANVAGNPVAAIQEGIIANYGGTLALYDGTGGTSNYLRLEYSAGYPKLSTSRTNLSLQASGAQLRLTGTYADLYVGVTQTAYWQNAGVAPVYQTRATAGQSGPHYNALNSSGVAEFSVSQGGSVTAAGNIQQGFNSVTASHRGRMLGVGQHASEVGDGAGTWQTGYREEYNVSGIRCGFYGATPIARQQIDSASATLAADLLAALNSLGLVEAI